VKTTIAYALTAVLIVTIGFAVSASDVTLNIGFNCDAVPTNGDLDFESEAGAPDGDSSSGDCGMFWSHVLTMTIHANANACWYLHSTNFIHTGNSAWTLKAYINKTNCAPNKDWAMNWSVWSGEKQVLLQIGVERKGYADHAGTYISTITISCDECLI